MKKYAVTAVFFIEAEDENEAMLVVDSTVIEDNLHKNKGESWSIVETSEVESF